MQHVISALNVISSLSLLDTIQQYQLRIKYLSLNSDPLLYSFMSSMSAVKDGLSSGVKFQQDLIILYLHV